MTGKLAPKRRYSQNFLVNEHIARAIVDAAQIGIADTVLEIGPGKGILTRYLALSAAARIVALDVDPRVQEYFKSVLHTVLDRIDLQTMDILHADLSRLGLNSENSITVVGNLPYSITSGILFWIFANNHAINRAVLMVQQEVARRIVSPAGMHDYGLLSVATWFHADAKILFHVKPGSFFPVPAVNSSVVILNMKKPVEAPEWNQISDFMRHLFSARRKMVCNALNTWCVNVTSYKYKELDSHPAIREFSSKRSGDLTPQNCIDLWRAIKGQVS